MHKPHSFFHLHLISDATGETLLAAGRAASAQYKDARAIEHIYPLIRTGRQLTKVFEDIEDEPGIVLYTVVDQSLARLIDEVPVLAALASRARGETVFREVGELRVKESDRLALVAANLRAIGAGAEVQGEDLVVAGGMEGPPRGRVRTAGDHRLAMAFGVLGTLPGARVGIDDRACAAVSFPGFWDLLQEATR